MDRIDSIIFQIAQKNAVSIEEVKRQIENTAIYGLESADPNIRFLWLQVPKKGEFPTAKEIISHFADIAIKISLA